MIKVPKLDFHIIDACNFGCEFCCHYSNFRLPANSISLDQAESIYSQWTGRIQPAEFILLGGEPTLHNQLIEHLHMTAKHWPISKRWLYTNGAFLDRHEGLPEALKETATTVYLSLHGTPHNKPYWDKFRESEELLKRWKRQLGVKFRIADCSHRWLAFYQLGEDKRPKPFTSDPPKAYQACTQKTCAILRPDGIYRCGTLGNFEAMATKLNLWDDPAWQKHRQYTETGKAENGCPDEKLREVLELKPIEACSLCPSKKQWVKRTNPLKKPSIKPSETTAG